MYNNKNLLVFTLLNHTHVYIYIYIYIYICVCVEKKCWRIFMGVVTVLGWGCDSFGVGVVTVFGWEL
jgi:hypothetical protein